MILVRILKTLKRNERIKETKELNQEIQKCNAKLLGITMNINYIEYSIATKSLDIFVAGCNPPMCKDCCNPELMNFDNGKDWHLFIPIIRKHILKFDLLIDNIFLLGGSFNHQDDKELCDILQFLSSFNKDIWLFARENLDNIKPVFKQYCNYIKCGAFIPELRCGDNIQYGIQLATSNQIIYQKGKDF